MVSRQTAAAVMGILFVAAGASGCSTRLLRRTVEKRLRNRLTTLIGPASHYSVSISGTDDDDLVLGRIRRLEVAGQEVRIGGEFPIQRLELRLEYVRYSGGSPDLISIRESDLLVEFTQASLNGYLAEHHPRDGVETRFDGDRVTIQMSLRLFGVPTPIQAKGKLAIAEGKRIVFLVEQVDAPNAPLGAPGRQLVERQLNPLLDLRALRVPIRLTSLQVTDGHILIHGAADLPPQKAGSAHNR